VFILKIRVQILLSDRLLAFPLSFSFPAHKFPEFAVSDDRLWFRYFHRWHWLEWPDIQKIGVIQANNHRTGLLIYSDKLPWFYRSYTRVLGRYALSDGRAILVTWVFPNLDELQSDIAAHIKQNVPTHKERCGF
jgi:hypothetical protein